MRLSRIRFICGLCSALALAGLVVAQVASAWVPTKSTNGVAISREATDSSKTVDVYVYYDYKGGDTDWGNAYTPTLTSSYNNSKLYDKAIAADWGTTFELDLNPNYRLQLVYVREDASPNTPLATFAVINEPLDVREVAPVSVVQVEGTPTVELASSTATLEVSAEGTLPVSVVGLGDDPLEPFIGLIGTAVGLFLGAFLLVDWGPK